MKTIRLLVELTYDNTIMGEDSDEVDWFYNNLLADSDNEGLILHSNMIGDEVGTIEVLEIL